jgi:hypothetical protein
MSTENRRTALKLFSASLGALAFPMKVFAAEYVPQHFTPAQMKLLDALTETIIPADEHSPGAKAANVAAYIDTIVVAAISEDKQFWEDGLAAIEETARRVHGKSFAACGASDQISLLEKIAAGEAHPRMVTERFFVTLKAATVDGYYTSAIGIHEDLQYQGNTMVMEFPGCTDANHQ